MSDTAAARPAHSSGDTHRSFESGRCGSWPRRPLNAEIAIGAVTLVARQLGIGPESVRKWVHQAEIDRGDRGGLTTEERERIKVLERENRELRRANEILKSAAVFFGAELDRRSPR